MFFFCFVSSVISINLTLSNLALKRYTGQSPFYSNNCLKGKTFFELSKIKASFFSSSFLYSSSSLITNKISHSDFSYFSKTAIKLDSVPADYEQITRVNHDSTTLMPTGKAWLLSNTFFRCEQGISTAQDLQMWSCEFTWCGTSYNISTTNGGGVSCVTSTQGNPIYLRSNSCRFNLCEANIGGGIYAINVQIDVFRTEFIDCKAKLGAAIYHEDHNNRNPNYIVSSLFFNCYTSNGHDLVSRITASLERNSKKFNLEFVRFDKPTNETAYAINTTDGLIQIDDLGHYRNEFNYGGGTVWRDSTATFTPTPSASNWPTRTATFAPTFAPTLQPTIAPTHAPTHQPTPYQTPSMSPETPIRTRTLLPTPSESVTATLRPTLSPTVAPTFLPTLQPTIAPTMTFGPTPNWTPEMTPGMTPLPSATPGPPAITWSSLGIGLLIFLLILLLIGIIANLLLCRFGLDSKKKIGLQIIDGRQGNEDDDGCCYRCCGCYC